MTAELANMTSAARRLHITQSALSRQIQQLEEELGVQLFERVGKKIRISSDGRALWSRIEDVMAAHRTLRGTADDLRGKKAAVLRVGACGIGVAVVPSCIRPLAASLTARPLAINHRALEFEICAMWDKREPLPDYAKRFVTSLGAYIASQQEPATTIERASNVVDLVRMHV